MNISLGVAIGSSAQITIFVSPLSDSQCGQLNAYLQSAQFHSCLIRLLGVQVIPFTVVLGWAIGVDMNLNLHEFETGALFASVVIVAILLQVRQLPMASILTFITVADVTVILSEADRCTGLQDGSSNWLKGLTLLISYLALAGAFYYHADNSLKALHQVVPAPQSPAPLPIST
eukprot:scaffold102357_cov41-Prasinocladus_malaysianus.AAC.2